MIKKPLVSIIIPCYNCEKSIKKCLDSIINQTYTNIEIIVINDGSKDNTLKVLKNYQSKDHRIVLIDQNNKGVSISRNEGIKEAMGEYITFVDSDDYLDSKAIAKYINVINENDVDLIIADFYRVLNNKNYHKGKIKNKRVFSIKDYGNYMLNNPADYYYGVLWNKLYKKSIIDKHNIKMPTELNFAEDFVFNMKYLNYVKKIYSINTPLYFYTKNETSLTALSLTIPSIVKMKTEVFKYYNNFYKKILNKDEYKKSVAKIYRFIVSPASDDGINITNDLVADLAVNYNSHLTRTYLHNSFYNLLLKDLSFKEKIKIDDLYIFSLLQTKDIKLYDIYTITGLGIKEMISALTTLEMKGYINIKVLKKKNDLNLYLKTTYLKKGIKLKKNINSIDKTYERIITKGISKKQLNVYNSLQNKINNNIINELKGE